MVIRTEIASTLNVQFFRKVVRACAIAALTALPVLALITAPQRLNQPRHAPTAPTPPATPAAPFRAGERLNYTVLWSRIGDAVSAHLAVLSEQDFYGRPAWHVQAQAHTNNPLRYIFTVDDQFDSYASRADFTGLQFEMYLHEQGKAENHIFRFSSSSSPAPTGATQVQVLPYTRDALGFTYYLRTVNWDKTEEVRAPVFDGRKIYEVRARVTTPREEVSVRAGRFSATAIGLRIYDRGTELSDTKLTIWIAQDSAHTPVLIEVELPFGSGRVELLGQGNTG